MDMNVIVLQGVGFYIFLAIVLFLAVSALLALLSSLALDKKCEDLQLQLEVEKRKSERLNRDYLFLKLKSGGLEPHQECR